ncbi:MAG TPA: helix-turn-helix domain-containing protein, partial [bacterium]
SHAVLFDGEKVFLTIYKEIEPRRVKDREIVADENLFERLRQLRKRIADERNVPPYIIFSDRTLKDMAAKIPTTWNQLQTVFGMGESKLKQHGPRFLKEIIAYAQQIGLELGERAYPVKKVSINKTRTEYATLDLLRQGLSVAEVASRRELTPLTIYNHIEQLILAGEDIILSKFVPVEKQQAIRKEFIRIGMEKLKPIKEVLGDDYSYEELQLVRANMVAEMRQRN